MLRAWSVQLVGRVQRHSYAHARIITTRGGHHYTEKIDIRERCSNRKKLIRKAIDSKEDINLALLAYRTAPLDCGLSPSELLMGRKLKTKLIIMKDKLLNSNSSFRQKNIQQRQVVQKRYHDSKAKDLAQLKQGGSCED